MAMTQCQSSSQVSGSHQIRPDQKKALQVRSSVKTMLTSFLDVGGIVHRQFVHPGYTVYQRFTGMC